MSTVRHPLKSSPEFYFPVQNTEGRKLYESLHQSYSPFPSCPRPHYQSEISFAFDEISFSYERMNTKTRFKEEAEGKLEMGYSRGVRRNTPT